jgi:hypothetical protein
MTCSVCKSSIALVSGKAGGYYGCLGATKSACGNRLLVRRTLLERVMLDGLRERIACAENLRYVLDRVSKEVARAYADVPEVIRLKRAELTALDRKVANFVEFIGEGRGSRALAEALEAAEREATSLRGELEGLERSREAVFQAPPTVWIEERLTTLQSVLERKTAKAALLLRKVLGPTQLKPVTPQVGRPYSRAISTLDALALIEPDPEEDPPEPGSNTLRKWRRGGSKP